jgi:hypothetical protein
MVSRRRQRVKLLVASKPSVGKRYDYVALLSETRIVSLTEERPAMYDYRLSTEE